MPGEEQPKASPNHEIETVERSSFEKDPATQQERTKEEIDKLFRQALKEKAAQREPKSGHEARVKLSTPQKNEYMAKFRQVFPNAPPEMLAEVERVLSGMPNEDADQELYTILPETETKPPPTDQIEVVKGAPRGPRTEHSPPDLEYPHESSRQMAVYAVGYLTFHRLLRDTCFQSKKGSKARKPNCCCVSHLCLYLRQCLHTLGGKDDVVAVKLYKIAVIPMITDLVESQRMIIDGENDATAFSRYVYGKVFVRPNATKNHFPHTIVNIGGRDTPLCMSIPMELFGRKFCQKLTQEFLNKWVTKHNYLRKIAVPRSVQSKLTRCVLEYFAEEGKFTTWTEPKEGKGEKVVLIDKIWKYLVGLRLLLGDDQNKETFKGILRDFKEVYEYLLQKEMLVIASPKFRPQFEGQLTDPAVSILFDLKGKLSYHSAKNGPISHSCNGGAVKVDGTAPFAKELLRGFIAAAGRGGRKNMNAPKPPDEESYSREKKRLKTAKNRGSMGLQIPGPNQESAQPEQYFLGPVSGSPSVLFKSSGIVKGNPFLQGLRMTGFSKDEAAALLPDTKDGRDGAEATFKRIVGACKSFLPKSVSDVKNLKVRSKINFLLNQGLPDEKKLSPQMLHTDYTAAGLLQMEEMGLWTFSAIMPLTDDGSWLMVTPQFDQNSDTPPKTKMVFIPLGYALVLPGTTIHAGGFRTANTGNPRIQLTIHLFDKKIQKKALDVIGEDFVSEWIGFNKEQNKGDDNDADPFCHSFVAVDWSDEAAIRQARNSEKSGDGKKGEAPQQPRPNNPHAHSRLYDLEGVQKLMNFIGH